MSKDMRDVAIIVAIITVVIVATIFLSGCSKPKKKGCGNTPTVKVSGPAAVKVPKK